MLEYVVQGFGDGHITGVVAWLLLGANAIVTGMVAVSFGSYASSAVTDGDETWAQGVRRGGRRGDDRAQHRRVAGGRKSADRRRGRRDRHPQHLRGVDARPTSISDLLAVSSYPSVADIVASVALTFFAFLGFGVITFTAKDLADPRRQLPRAMYLALGIATDDLRRRRARRVRHAHGRRGDRLGRHRARGGRRARRSGGPATG